MSPVSVLLVDDNPLFLRIINRFLREQHQSEVEVVGAATGGREALTLAKELRPQVILIDLAMPDLPGLKAIPQLRSLLPEAVIIALTILDNHIYRAAARTAGADDFISKASLHTDLLPAIHRITQTHYRMQEARDRASPKDVGR